MEYKLICAGGIFYVPEGASITIIDSDDLPVLEITNEDGALHVEVYQSEVEVTEPEV